MSNEELNYNNSDDEVLDKHPKLLESIEKLDKGQRIKRPKRSEPTSQISEFHLVNSGITKNDVVSVDQLFKKLGGQAYQKNIKNKFNTTKKQMHVLPKPLPKTTADKLKRAIGFENTTKELDKWNAIVTRNRVAPKQVFPLQSSLRVQPSDEFVKSFTLQSELEKNLNALEPEKPNEIKEKTNEFSLTLKEMIQKKKEAAKFRAQQSYKQAKAHRQKKIKSKKYHRIEKNTKVKEQLKEFAKLQATDPQAALEKLEQLSKTRAEERMSLKHKNTGQWAKNKQIRAKYDKESREALAQQLSISRELTQKVKAFDSSDDDNDNDGAVKNGTEAAKLDTYSENNPWVQSKKTQSEIDDFVSDYRKYWEKTHASMKKNDTELTEKKDECILNDSESKKDNHLTNPVVEKIQKHVDGKEKHTNDLNNTDSFSKKKKQKHTMTQQPKNAVSHDNKVVDNKKITSNSAKKKVKGSSIKTIGTSKWSVDIIDNVEQSVNKKSAKLQAIDDIFDTIDDKVNEKIKKKLRRVKRKLSKIPAEKSENVDESNHHVTDLAFKKLKLRPDVDEPLNEIAGRREQSDSQISPNVELLSTRNNPVKIDCLPSKNTAIEINPNEFINVKSQHAKNHIINDEINQNDLNDSDDEKEGEENIISQAFADDDVVDEFKKEKADEIAKIQSGNIDTRLPGWGTWGGSNLKLSMKKKRRFIFKFPKITPKNNENKGNVIVIQDDSFVKKHQVNDLPYPFSSVSDFETSIRAPIGRNFIPENAHRQLIEPAVKTKMGKIIEPMDESVLIDNKDIQFNGKLVRSKKKNVTIKK